MILTVSLVLVIAAFVCTVAAAISPPRAPLWVAVLLLVVLHLVLLLPR
jgi:hypothetical protein